jgi:hypothetical protein
MRDTDIPTKTRAGRDEIIQRRRRLTPHQRALLIAIRGEQTIGEIRQHFRVLGDVDVVIGELLAAGLIVADGEQGPAVVAVPAPEPAAAAGSAGVAVLMGARQFMNETAVAALGLRAFLFTLKLERCHTRQELLDLLPEYHRVLSKAKGAEFANAMTRNAEKLLAER